MAICPEAAGVQHSIFAKNKFHWMLLQNTGTKKKCPYCYSVVRANQWTGFYMITASVIKQLRTLWLSFFVLVKQREKDVVSTQRLIAFSLFLLIHSSFQKELFNHILNHQHCFIGILLNPFRVKVLIYFNAYLNKP